MFDTFNFVQDFETEDPQLVAEPGVGRNHGKTMGKSRGHYSGPTVWTGPTSKFFNTNTGVHIPRMETRSSTSSLQKHRQGGWLLRQLKGESRTAAEVVMDDALVQDDGIDLIVEELDRCWEVTQDQDKASKIEKALYETPRDTAIETTFMSYVTRRKLHFQQLENALGTSLPAVIKGYATLRDVKLAESSYDKVVMWTGGSYDYDDVVRALVRLDRPEMRVGTSGQSGNTQGPRMKRSSIQQLKLRTRCARCRKLGHWARECPEGNRGQRNEERYDRRAVRPGEKPRGFITVAQPTERRPFFLGASWTFVSLDPGEVLWDTGDHVGLVGKQQLDQCCKLLAEHGLQVEWSQEKPESASGIGGTTKPIGVVYVPVGLAAWI